MEPPPLLGSSLSWAATCSASGGAARGGAGPCGRRLRESTQDVQRRGDSEHAPSEKERGDANEACDDHRDLALRDARVQPWDGEHLALEAELSCQRVER